MVGDGRAGGRLLSIGVAARDLSAGRRRRGFGGLVGNTLVVRAKGGEARAGYGDDGGGGDGRTDAVGTRCTVVVVAAHRPPADPVSSPPPRCFTVGGADVAAAVDGTTTAVTASRPFRIRSFSF